MFLDMDLAAKIAECETIAELNALESMYILNNVESELLYERRVELITRLCEWRYENEQMGLAMDISDSWTPEQREAFLRDWFDDQVILQTNHEEKRSHEEINEGASTSQMDRGQKRSYDEMLDGDEPLELNGALQANPSEKRSYEEMLDGDEPLQVGHGQDDERPFNIESVTQVNIKKFRTTGMNYRVRFTNAFADLEISSLHDRLHEVFQQILDETIGGVPPQDQVRVILHSTQLEYPITFPFMAPHRLTTERILAEFQRVIQSNQEFRLNDTVDVNVIHVSMPSGGKGSKRSEINLEKHLEKKRSIVRIQNDDDLCMARALVVAKAKLDNDTRDRHIRDPHRPLQTRLAQELHQNAGVPLGPCGLEEAKQFQAYLTDYQISIVSKEYSNKIIYAGPEKEKKIYLYMHNNHYDVITKMPGFFASVYYCHTCKKAYNNHEDHRCPNACKCCRFPSECPEVSWQTCQDCHRLFKSQQCYDQHKQSRGDARSVCQSLVKCTKCQKVVRRYKQLPEKHRCGLTKCWICGKFVQLEGHRCFIQPETKKKKTSHEVEEEEEVPENGYDVSAFFDTECRQGEREPEDEPVEESLQELLLFDFECRQENGNHEPNLCIVQNEAGDEWIFQGDNTRYEFCEWLFTTEHANCRVMAHNFQGYDSYFVLQYLREHGVKYDVIMRGAKVLSLTVDMFNIRFVDSLNFIPMKLANFPKTFGIEELAKGYFPHLFN